MTDQPRRRGRPPRAEPARPSGYRMTADVERQVRLAAAMTDDRTLQAVIDRAVREYLARLRRDRPEFASAVRNTRAAK